MTLCTNTSRPFLYAISIGRYRKNINGSLILSIIYCVSDLPVTYRTGTGAPCIFSYINIQIASSEQAIKNYEYTFVCIAELNDISDICISVGQQNLKAHLKVSI